MNTSEEPTILLASASPRRRALLALLGIPYATASADIEEILDPAYADRPDLLAESLALKKALSVACSDTTSLVLAFDTIVVHAGALLGKPEDEKHARTMLHSLSGKEHRVITGGALRSITTGGLHTFSVCTPVRMNTLDQSAIDEWLASGHEYLGCAGAYNIERHLARVDSGACFQNVVGLPLCHLYAALKAPHYRENGSRATPPAPRCDAARGTHCELGPRIIAGR